MNAAATRLAVRSLLVLGLVVVIGIAAYVRGDEPGITFATHGIDLQIDSKAWYNGSPVASATLSLKNLVPGSDHFFNFNDIKPGDYGCNVISMHVKKTDAWMCLDFKNLQSADNGVNEPEAPVDPNGNASGELASGTEFFGWVDDGDGIFEPPSEKALFGTSTQAASSVLNDKTYVIGDSKGGGQCKQNTTRYVGICWCAGDLTVNMSTGKIDCDGGALGNAAQTDSFSVDISIRAEPAREKPKFICGSKPPKGGHGDGEDDDKGDKNNDGKDGKGNDNQGGKDGGSSDTNDKGHAGSNDDRGKGHTGSSSDGHTGSSNSNRR